MIATFGVFPFRHDDQRTILKGASRIELHHQTVAPGGLPRNN